MKHLLNARKGQRGKSKGNKRREATAREAMEKGRGIRVIERKEVGKDDPIEFFLPTGSEISFKSQRR